jgi:hypothetical protein
MVALDMQTAETGATNSECLRTLRELPYRLGKTCILIVALKVHETIAGNLPGCD